MEASARMIWLPEHGGNKPSLGFRGYKIAHCVVNTETAIRVIPIPIRDFDHSPPLRLGRIDYPVDRIIDRFLEIGTRKGITGKARALLGSLSAAIDERQLETIPDDEPRSETPAAPPEEPVARLSSRKPTRARVSPPNARKAPAERSNSSPRTGGKDLIRSIAAELRIDPPKLRKHLRSAGLRAPYTDEQAIRSALKSTKELG